MASCTFFGHRNCPEHIKPKIKAELYALIAAGSVDTFYVGNQGAFDSMVYSILESLAEMFPHINYVTVLAYMPKPCVCTSLPTNSILPEGIENVHERFAISWRNDWMLARSDIVIAYVIHDWGGAAKFVDKAIQQGKTVINIAE